MKKIIGLILLAVLVTGCNKETLTCSKEEKVNGVLMSEKYEIEFKKEKLNHIKIIKTVSTEDEIIRGYWDNLVSSMVDAYALEELNGVTTDEEKDSDNYKYNHFINIKIKDTDEDIFVKLGIEEVFQKVSTVDQLRVTFGNKSYFCE